MKIFVFADPHYSDIEVSCKTRRPSRSLAKLKELSDVISGCDRIICLGDLTDKCESFDSAKARLGEISEFLHSFGIPVDALMGNHDCQTFSTVEFCQIGSFSAAPYCVHAGESTLIFLDANFMSDGSRSYLHNSDWTDSNLPQEQLDFLEEVLERIPDGENAAFGVYADCGKTDNLTSNAASDANRHHSNSGGSGKNKSSGSVFVFLHQCLDLDVEPRHIIKNAHKIRAVLSRAASRGIFVHALSGHYHRGGENEIDGVRYTTVSALCELDGMPYVILEV